MLRADAVAVHYGAVTAVRGVSLAVEPGTILAVLGPNGAGKTSLLRAISGLVPHGGEVTVDGDAVRSPHGAVALGVAHVVQGRGLFRRLSVGQNVELGPHGGSSERSAGVAIARERIPELDEWWTRRVGTLSGGEQVLVALGRLLAARPRYALVDELTLGLAPIARDRVDDELRRLRDDGVGLVLVDQHAPRALTLADDVLVMERGSQVFAGRARDADPEQIAGSTLGAAR